MKSLLFGLALAASPAQSPAADAAAPPVTDVNAPVDPNPDSPLLQHRVLQYRRDALQVRPVQTRLWAPPVPVEDNGLGVADPLAWWSHSEANGEVPDWGIVRGRSEIIDELALADMLEDRALRHAIEDRRFWPRVAWTSTFGAMGAGALGTGVWLTWSTPGPHTGDTHRDRVAIGTSLLATGVASVVLALLFPEMTPQHVLSASEAQSLCNDFNEDLRKNLDLSAADLRRF